MSKKYYLLNYEKNPTNLRGQPDHCKKARRRYKLHPHHCNAFPDFKYLAYEQCLPGCVVNKNNAFNRTVTLVAGDRKSILLTNDTKCEAYDNKVTNSTRYCNKLLKASLKSAENTGNSHNTGRQKPSMITQQFNILGYIRKFEKKLRAMRI